MVLMERRNKSEMI